ncbi:immunity 49 family protein [Streptomyces enissocaesilis]|uniref:Immunity 49 family protein n=1 Tax=Streptomyces enissocaesilis TaxID=332589 RepID=A0ABN3XLB0_9ACTN
MQMEIPRHDFPTRNAASVLDSRGGDFWQDVEALQDEPSWFSNALASGVQLWGLRCAVDPESDRFETWEACVTAMQVGSALFASAQATTDGIECRIGHKTHTIRAGALPRAHAGNWLTAFWLACVCREKKRMMAGLCRFPVSRLREADGIFDAYIYDWVRALQAYWLNGDKLVAAVDGIDPDALGHAPHDGVLQIMYPPMNLLSQLAHGDQDAFNAELAKALEWRKGYWARDEDRELNAQGFVALGPLAVACLTVQAGFTISVESEYLPERLLDGSRVNEFPT